MCRSINSQGKELAVSQVYCKFNLMIGYMLWRIMHILKVCLWLKRKGRKIFPKSYLLGSKYLRFYLVCIIFLPWFFSGVQTLKLIGMMVAWMQVMVCDNCWVLVSRLFEWMDLMWKRVMFCCTVQTKIEK